MLNRRIKKILILIIVLLGMWQLGLLGLKKWGTERDKPHVAEGIAAVVNIQRWFGYSVVNIKNAFSTIFSTGFPGDPEYYFKFEIEVSDIEQFIKKYQLHKAELDKYIFERNDPRIPNWWQIQKNIPLIYYKGFQDDNYFYLIYYERIKTCYLYIQNT